MGAPQHGHAGPDDSEDEVLDLTEPVLELEADIKDACAESGLPPPAVVFACLQVVYAHAADMAGLDCLRTLISQHEAMWIALHADSDPLIHPPHQGALQ